MCQMMMNTRDANKAETENREYLGRSLQSSCLENPMGGEAWWAAVHGVAKSRTGLSDFTFTSFFRPHLAECGILVPQPGIKLMPPDLGAQNLEHWTAGKSCFGHFCLVF